MPRRKEGRNRNREGGTSVGKDGRVRAYVTVDTPLGPRQVRTTKRTQEEADDWLVEVKYLARKGAFASYDADGLSVSEFVGRWLRDEIEPTVRAVTFLQYEKTNRLKVAPTALGKTKLSKLTVANCQAWRSAMTKDGVSAQERGKAIRLLKRALEQAVAWEMIPKNPAAHLRSPRYRPKETPYMRTDGLRPYLDAVRSDPFEALYVAAILNGFRPAELLALRWEDYDDREGTLRVNESVSHLPGGVEDWNDPKTRMGRRVVPLLSKAHSRLLEHRKRVLERRMATGERSDFARSLIFPRPDDPTRSYGHHALRHRLYALQDRAGLPRVHLRSLRHTATMLHAGGGSDLKSMQNNFGHADVRTTMQIYAHFEEERARESASRVDDYLASKGAGNGQE